MRNTRNRRRRRLAGHASGCVARLVVTGLFVAWLYTALQEEWVTVAWLTVAIILTESVIE